MVKFNFRTRHLQWLLSSVLMVGSVTLLTQPAQANCAGGRPPEQVDPGVLQRWNRIKDDTSFSWNINKVFDRMRDRRITLTPAFDRLSGSEKQNALTALALDGSSYEVYTADGRLVSAQYDGCTKRKALLTERDRYGWYLTRLPAPMPFPMLRDALRNPGQPSWRNVKVSIHPEDERRARFQFWQTVGYAQYAKGWWIAWVPEGGYFEITVANADGLTAIQPYLETAAQTYRYVVITQDGTPLTDTQYSRGNPWQWVLGKTTAPPAWQIKPCGGELLCATKGSATKGSATKGSQQLGSVILQRWDIQQRPDLFKALTEQGLAPGLITYANPNDRAKVLAALKVLIADYYQIIRSDRLSTYGTRFGVMERPPIAAPVGKLPGWVYGFVSVGKTGEVYERYVSYMAFDGSRYLYIITTSFDPAAATSKFETLADLEQFEPHLNAIVANLNLPHPDW
jgi:hypothetical protein